MRQDTSSDGIGLEIPINAPLEERSDQWGPGFGSWISISLWRCVRRRTHSEINAAAIPPKIAPGKKPATTALLGKEGHCERE